MNRVILCTDGDFNVGVTGPGALEELIASEAATGVELTVLGFGDSSRGDERMEALSNRGNGNYALIDSELEARKVLAEQVGGTLLTVASDVKIQVAWNPAQVAAFRLVGYENRRLEHQDFLDDGKDAGEIGAGHGVTALFEAEAGLASAVRSGRWSTPTTRSPRPTRGTVWWRCACATRSPAPRAARLRGRWQGRRELRRRAGGPAIRRGRGDLRPDPAGSARGRGVSADAVREWALLAKGDDPGGLREGFVLFVERWIDMQRPGEER